MSQLLTGGLGVTTTLRVRPKTVRPGVGGYVISRRLGWGRCGERWLAHLDPAGEAYVACRLDAERFGGARRDVRDYIGRWTWLRHRHVVEVESCVVDEGRDPWVMMPYTGDADGLVTLATLLVRRGGQLGAREAARCAGQLLGVSESAHLKGLVHGRFATDEIVVDRSGSIGVELYGLRAGFGIDHGDGGATSTGGEVRSVVEIAYELATGVPAALAGKRPYGLAGREGKRLAAWLDGGLRAGGYDDAATALAALDA